MKKNTNLTWFVAKILYANAAKENIFVACNRVAATKLDSKFYIFKGHIRDQCFRQITQVTLPTFLKNPRKLAAGPHAKPKRESLAVILLPDMRKINVADLVLIVEINEQSAVSDRNISHILIRTVTLSWPTYSRKTLSMF